MEYTKEHSGLSSWFKKLRYLFNQRIFKQQKTYILPTLFGLAYGSLCFILLLMGMAYGNNLVYIVCFYLTTMGLAAAKMTNDHVDQVLLEKVYVKDTFAEENQILYVQIRNTGKNTLKKIEVKIAKQKYSVSIDLNPEEVQTIELLWTPPKRGVHKIPVVRAQSSYPAGLFQAWRLLKSSEKAVVFPTRRGKREFPQAGSTSQDSIGILKEIREYRAGDSPKRIHWRSLAKSNQLRTLIHEGNENQICHLVWEQLESLSLESKLEQLSLWISLAESQNLAWKLKLPTGEYDSENGNSSRMALTQLANWKQP